MLRIIIICILKSSACVKGGCLHVSTVCMNASLTLCVQYMCVFVQEKGATGSRPQTHSTWTNTKLLNSIWLKGIKRSSSVFFKSFSVQTVSICGSWEEKMDVKDMGRQTRGTNKREENNKAKQWSHQSWEMDGGRERQRQKKGRWEVDREGEGFWGG